MITDLKGRPEGGRLLAALCAMGIVVSLAAAACDDAPPEPDPVPGDAVVTLISPNDAEGAAVLETSDEGIVEVSAEDPVQAFHWREGGLTRIVVFLDPAGEIRFTMSVTNVNRPPRLDLVEVADGANRLRGSLLFYRIEVEPVTGA